MNFRGIKAFKSNPTFHLGVMLFIYIAMVIYLLQDYFIINSNICMGLMLAPYILITKRGEYSYKYIIPLVLCVIANFFMPVKSILFLTLLFGLLFLIESSFGKINNSFFILLFLISPVFNYFNNSIGFPIRIWLSEISGSILGFVGKNVKITGNLISIDGNEFSVDSACAGLNMIMVSLIIALFILTYYQRKTKEQISIIKVSLFLTLAFILNIICNLIRILTLVNFQIMEDDPWHQIIGILCLVTYVIIPLIIISGKIFDGPAVSIIKSTPNSEKMVLKLLLNTGMIVIIFISGIRISTYPHLFPLNNYYLEGYNKTILKTGVIKFEDHNSLVYLKPMKFYSAEHNPMICWRGSGYEFDHINTEVVNGFEIFTGILKKDNDVIYTAWWFDNGKYNTISQLDWRWKVLQDSDDFCLVNISAESRNDLISEATSLLNKMTYKN